MPVLTTSITLCCKRMGFDESFDETEYGEDPVELNRESATKWKPYLEKEIDHIEPN